MTSRSIPIAEPLAKLIDELSRLPGIGPKSAQRLSYYLLRAPESQAEALAEAIIQLKRRISLCSICFNITEDDPCLICRDISRDRSIICVVEDPLDMMALERALRRGPSTGSGQRPGQAIGFRGLYHVLHGVISPIEGVGPEQLRIRELLTRLREDSVKEVIVATNPNLEGDATAMYLQRLIAPLGIRTTRLARGLPVGADLEYADDVTLARALEGRQEV